MVVPPFLLSINSYPLTTDKRYLFFLLLILISCGPESIDNAVVIPLDLPGEVMDVCFIDDERGFAVGGDIWFSGFIGTTEDGGESWTFDSLTNKVVTAIDINDNTIVCGGLDGKLFFYENNDWIFKRSKDWRFIKDIIALSSNEVLSTGGLAFRGGFINHIENVRVDSVWNENIELRAITRVNDELIIAAGFGIILRSTDRGQNWNIADGQGDFFTDLCFIDDLTGYVVGLSGLILKTTDGGESWDTSRRLGDLSGSDRLQGIAQISTDELWAIGKEGKVLITTDGGDSWETHKLDTDADLLSINAQTDKIFISGEDEFFVAIDK